MESSDEHEDSCYRYQGKSPLINKMKKKPINFEVSQDSSSSTSIIVNGQTSCVEDYSCDQIR